HASTQAPGGAFPVVCFGACGDDLNPRVRTSGRREVADERTHCDAVTLKEGPTRELAFGPGRDDPPTACARIGGYGNGNADAASAHVHRSRVRRFTGARVDVAGRRPPRGPGVRGQRLGSLPVVLQAVRAAPPPTGPSAEPAVHHGSG